MKKLILIFIWITGLTSYAKELRILCWEGYANREYTEEFERFVGKKFGEEIKITVLNVSDPKEFFFKLRKGDVDLVSPAHNIPKSTRWPLIKGKLVLPINLENIPNYKHLLDPLKNAKYITNGDGQIYGVPIVYGPYGLFYNTNIIKKEPKSWSIFWDPKYKNQYSISSDYHEANIYFAALAMGYKKEKVFDFGTLYKNKHFRKRLATLASHSNNFWVGVDSADKLSGLAFATGWGFALNDLKKKGEIWKMANPIEGTTGWVDNWLISWTLKDKPKLKEIAEAWINYTLGHKMQLNYMRNLNQFPVNTEVKKYATKKEIAAFKLNQPSFFKEKFILWKTLDSRSQNGFEVMWKKAKKSR
jgi:spermidine/putrescine transport system substrate-binding protein